MPMPLRRPLREAVLLLLLSVILALGVNAVRPDGLALREDFARKQAAPKAQARFSSISPMEAADLQDQGRAVFVDSREALFFAKAHIPKARNLTLAQIQAGEGQDLPRDKTVIVYCDGLACGKSRAVAEALAGRGLSVAVMQDGIEGWIMTRGTLERAE